MFAGLAWQDFIDDNCVVFDSEDEAVREDRQSRTSESEEEEDQSATLQVLNQNFTLVSLL